MPTLTNIQYLLLEDLYKHEMPQCSWDWPADERFAWMLGNAGAAELIRDAINSGATLPAGEAAVKYYGIPKKRLRVLRSLVALGLVESYWTGLGEGAYNQFGVRRARVYRITKNGKAAYTGTWG